MPPRPATRLLGETPSKAPIVIREVLEACVDQSRAVHRFAITRNLEPLFEFVPQLKCTEVFVLVQGVLLELVDPLIPPLDQSMSSVSAGRPPHANDRMEADDDFG